jgi:polyferredoxin
MVAMTTDKIASAATGLARWRWRVQSLFLLAWMDPFLLRLHGVCGPVFHCYSCPLATFACPIGVLANFSAVHLVPYLAIGTLLVVGMIAGSFVCGWACPFGFLQDLLHRIPAPKFTLPAWTGWLRYGVLLGLVLAIPYWYGEPHALFFCRVCPAGALEAALPHTVSTVIHGDPVAWPGGAKIVILLATMAGAVLLWRPWCGVLCPLGAIFGLCNRVSFLYLHFHTERCRDCQRCRSLCHRGGRPQERVDDLRCVRCLECDQCSAVSVDSVFRIAEKKQSGD